MWFLAGMCLLVSGITYMARTDTRMAQLHLARATAVAAGDGAILLMLAGLGGDEPSAPAFTAPVTGNFTLGPREVSVVVVPTNGLVNLNIAPAAVLARLFAMQGAVDNADARLIARSVVEWRRNTGPHRDADTGGYFQSPEDLLQVPGVTRALWDTVRDFIVVEGGSTGGSLEVAMAPDELRAAFEEAGSVASGDSQRTAGEGATAGSPARSWRVDALVETGGQTWLRRKWVALGSGGDSPLPWHYSRVEAPRVVAARIVERGQAG
jgi:hypothetical protein